MRNDDRVLLALIFVLSVGCMGILWTNSVQPDFTSQLLWWVSEVLLLALATLSAYTFLQYARGERTGWFW
jgi:hypothetical protein